MFTTWDILLRSLEAAAVTLFASLWFDSLGHGGWWLLFSLVGLIVSFAGLQGATRWQRREALIHATRDVVRYVVAGDILAWRLGLGCSVGLRFRVPLCTFRLAVTLSGIA